MDLHRSNGIKMKYFPFREIIAQVYDDHNLGKQFRYFGTTRKVKN